MFPEKQRADRETLLTVDTVSISGMIRDISFRLKRGEILGIAGVLGAGKTQLAKAIYGVRMDGVSGKMQLDGQVFDLKYPEIRLKHGIVYVPEDRKREGLIPGLSVYQNLLIGNAQHVSTRTVGHIYRNAAAWLSQDVVSQTDVRLRSIDQPMDTLSGGNQQKAIIGKWIFSDPEIVLLDEPTRGIDVGAKTELYRLIASLANRGKGIIMFSSETAELVGLCQRVLVLYKGRIVKELAGDEITADAVLSYAVGAAEE